MLQTLRTPKEQAPEAGPKQRALRLLGPLMAVLLIAGAAVVLWQMATTISLAAVGTALVSIPVWRLAAALGFTLLGLCALAAYDVVAFQVVRTGHRVSVGRAMVGSLVANIFANALGFPMLSAGSARYRIYSMAGAGLPEVARLMILSWITMWCGIFFVLGLTLLLEPARQTPVFGWQDLDRGIGALLFFGLFAFVVWAARRRKAIRVGGWGIRLPRARTALAMIVAGSVDLVCAAGALYVLLPGDAAPDLARYMVAYSVGLVAGMISNSPGGIGVFEAALVTGLGVADRPDVAAGLILFRLIYFVLPLAFAVLLLGGAEVQHRIRRRAGSGP